MCKNCNLPRYCCFTALCYHNIENNVQNNVHDINCNCDECVKNLEKEALKHIELLGLIYKQRYPNKTDDWKSLIVKDFLDLIYKGIKKIQLLINDKTPEKHQNQGVLDNNNKKTEL